MNQRPTLVFFVPDSWRGDMLGHMGNAGAITPHLDAMVATDAVSFRNAFCQNPVCVPSRCSFLTGWYPHVRGHRSQYHMLSAQEPMLLKRLKDSGYHVWWGGKNDVVPAQNGYDAYCSVRYQAPGAVQPDPHSWEDWRGKPGGDGYFSFYLGQLEKKAGEEYRRDSDAATVEGALAQIQSAPADKPLCIYLSLGNPHPPYAVEEPWFSMADQAKLPPRIRLAGGWAGKPALPGKIAERQGTQAWTEERWRQLKAVYYGMAARSDMLFGKVVAALKEKGLYEDAGIFFFSDHGDYTGDYGLVEKTQNTFEDCLTRVPLVFKPPVGLGARPGVSDALVELIDFPATVEVLAGLGRDYEHFGRSLLPLATGQATELRDAVFSEGGRLPGETQATEDEYLEVKEDGQASLYWPRLSLECEEGKPFLHGKAVMCRTRDYKYVSRLFESDELYDLKRDPGEEHNLIDDPALAAVRSALKDRLLRFYQETADVVPLFKDRRH